jgi:hypothetical protein
MELLGIGHCLTSHFPICSPGMAVTNRNKRDTVLGGWQSHKVEGTWALSAWVEQSCPPA